MILDLEFRKWKRSALIPMLILGGILSATFPVINLLVREESLMSLPNSSLEILIKSSWMMMATINSLLMALGACIVYHVEYEFNAIQKMNTLPLRSSDLFFGKFLMLLIIFSVIYIIQGIAFYFCILNWFVLTENLHWDLVRFMVYAFVLSMPVLSFMLTVSSRCKNMWITIGIGVIGVFIAQLLSNGNNFNFFPFLMPYQPVKTGSIAIDFILVGGALVVTSVSLFIGVTLSKFRRDAV